MADIAQLIQVLTVNNKEQIKEQDSRHQEQMNDQGTCRRHKKQIAEQA